MNVKVFVHSGNEDAKPSGVAEANELAGEIDAQPPADASEGESRQEPAGEKELTYLFHSLSKSHTSSLRLILSLLFSHCHSGYRGTLNNYSHY